MPEQRLPFRRPRVVLLDAGFTLTFCDGARIATLARAAGATVEASALEAAEPALRRELAQYVWASTPTSTAKSAGGGPGFFRRMLELAGATLSAGAAGNAASGSGVSAEGLDGVAAAIWEGHLRSNVWRRVGAGVREALADLRAAGLRAAVVSNSEGTVEAMLKETGLHTHLETVVDSWVVGVAKPDPRIFHIALERLGATAADAVMVGDSPTADVAGAVNAGSALCCSIRSTCTLDRPPNGSWTWRLACGRCWRRRSGLRLDADRRLAGLAVRSRAAVRTRSDARAAQGADPTRDATSRRRPARGG